MKPTYVIVFALMFCWSATAWAQDEDPVLLLEEDAATDAQEAPEPAPESATQDDDESLIFVDAEDEPTADESLEADAADDIFAADDADDADEIDYEAREAEIDEICSAACTGAYAEGECSDACVDQTTACFEQCDELPANKNDCFVGCTHIAVDERDRQEEELDQLAASGALEDEPVYGRKFAFGMNAVGGIHHVPNFLVGAFFDRHIGHWDDGAKFFYGGEFVFRFNDQHDLLLTIDYANYTTQDGWWLEKDKNATAAEWVHNDMHALAITVGWNGIANLDKKKRVQIYGGIGLGVTLKFGDFNKAKVRLGCVDPSTNTDVYDTLTPDGTCPEDSGRVLIDQDSSGEITDWTQEKIPAILPSIHATLGFRYLIADTVSIGVEGGWKTVAFYGGLKVGFVVGKSNAKREREQAREAQTP